MIREHKKCALAVYGTELLPTWNEALSLSIVESVLQQKQLKSCQESKYMHRKKHTLSNFDVSIY